MSSNGKKNTRSRPKKASPQKDSSTKNLTPLTKPRVQDSFPVPATPDPSADPFASPQLNRTAKSVFQNPPPDDATTGGGAAAPSPPLFTSEISLQDTPEAVTATSEADALQLPSVDEVETTSSCAAAAAPSSPTSSFASSGCASPAYDASTALFHHGDLVWAQTDAKFPFWPAFVFDSSLLPPDIQQSLLISKHAASARKKMPVYFYGRNDYDLVRPSNMKEFRKNRDTLKNQTLDSSLGVAFRRGLRLADEDCTKPIEKRVSWIFNASTGSTTLSRSSSRNNSRSNTPQAGSSAQNQSMRVPSKEDEKDQLKASASADSSVGGGDSAIESIQVDNASQPVNANQLSQSLLVDDKNLDKNASQQQLVHEVYSIPEAPVGAEDISPIVEIKHEIAAEALSAEEPLAAASTPTEVTKSTDDNKTKDYKPRDASALFGGSSVTLPSKPKTAAVVVNKKESVGDLFGSAPTTAMSKPAAANVVKGGARRALPDASMTFGAPTAACSDPFSVGPPNPIPHHPSAISASASNLFAASPRTQFGEGKGSDASSLFETPSASQSPFDTFTTTSASAQEEKQPVNAPADEIRLPSSELETIRPTDLPDGAINMMTKEESPKVDNIPTSSLSGEVVDVTSALASLSVTEQDTQEQVPTVELNVDEINENSGSIKSTMAPLSNPSTATDPTPLTMSSPVIIPSSENELMTNSPPPLPSRQVDGSESTPREQTAATEGQIMRGMSPSRSNPTLVETAVESAVTPSHAAGELDQSSSSKAEKSIPAASTLQQPAKAVRTSSARPVFKGKAKIVSGASPFDSGGSKGISSVDQLFGPPQPRTESSSAAVLPSSKKVTSNSAASLFGSSTATPSIPTNNTTRTVAASSDAFFGASASSASDPFSSIPAPAPISTAPTSSSGLSSARRSASGKSLAGTPVGARVMTQKAPPSASEVFACAPKVEEPKYVTTDPFLPPAAPGVKRATSMTSSTPSPHPGMSTTPVSGLGTPTTSHTASASAANVFSPRSAASSATATISAAGVPHPFGTAVAPVGVATNVEVDPVIGSSPQVTSKSRKSSGIAKKKAPPAAPEGMIATPHGFVPIPAATSSTAVPPPSSAPCTSVEQLSTVPLVNAEKLTSLVQQTHVETEFPAHHQSVSDTNAQELFSRRRAPSKDLPQTGVNRDKRVKPVAAIAAFGFGGKIVTMFPKKSHLGSMAPSFHPIHGGNQGSAAAGSQPVSEQLRYYNGSIKIQKLNQLLSANSGDNCTNREMDYFFRSLTDFQGPLKSVDNVGTGDDSSSTEEVVRQYLENRWKHPIVSILPETALGSLSNSKREQLIDSEKMLLSMVKIMMQFKGKMHSDAGATDPSSPEARIIQLLVGAKSFLNQRNKTNEQSEADVVTHNERETSKSFPSGAPSIFTPLAHDACSGNLFNHDESIGEGSCDLQLDLSSSRKLHEALRTTAPGLSANASVAYSNVEELLVLGKREEALKLAITAQDWALAILISCVCGGEKYQEVVRAYAASRFPSATPLHLLAMMYSNQGAQSIMQKEQAVVNEETLMKMWRQNLAAILSNKANDWQQLTKLLGYRLHVEQQDLCAAHVAYLTCGALPAYPVSVTPNAAAGSGTTTGPAGTIFKNPATLQGAESTPPVSTVPPSASGKENSLSTTSAPPTDDPMTTAIASSVDLKVMKVAGKYALLGCDATLPRHKQVGDCISIAALRLTEIVEWTLLQQLSEHASTNSTAGAGGGVSTFSQLLGWNKSATAADTKGTKKAPQSLHAQTNSHDNILKQQILRMRAALCPIKLRFAIVLADFGLTDAAISYALGAKEVVNEVGTTAQSGASNSSHSAAGNRSAGRSATSNEGCSTQPLAKPFSPAFVRALDEFLDRLGVRLTSNNGGKGGGNLSTAAASGSTKTSPGSSGIWDFTSSVLSSINLKELVDGPEGMATSKDSAIHRPVTNPDTVAVGFTVSSSHPTHSAPPMAGAPPVGGIAAVRDGNSAEVVDDGFGLNTEFPTVAAPASSSKSADFGLYEIDLNQDSSTGINHEMSQQHAVQMQSVSGQQPHHFDHPPLHHHQQQHTSPDSGGGGWYVGKSAPDLQRGWETSSTASNKSNTPPGSMHHYQQQPNSGYIAPENNSLSNSRQEGGSSGNFFGFGGIASAESTTPVVSSTKVNTSPAPSSGDGGGSSGKEDGPGLVGNLRKGLLKWMYPDAHDTTENMGKSVDAYFDKATGKWVFPGEENAAANGPAAGPPPTSMSSPHLTTSSSMSMFGASPGTPGGPANISPSPSYSAMGPPSNGVGPPAAVAPPGSGDGSTGSMDSLSALMAPPSNRYSLGSAGASSNAASDSGDPLAMLMAPPSSRYNSLQGAPPAGGPSPAAPPVTMWKPPPMPKTNSNSSFQQQSPIPDAPDAGGVEQMQSKGSRDGIASMVSEQPSTTGTGGPPPPPFS